MMVTLDDHIQEVVVLDVLDHVRVYTLISVEIKTWRIDFEESQYWCGYSFVVFITTHRFYCGPFY